MTFANAKAVNVDACPGQASLRISSLPSRYFVLEERTSWTIFFLSLRGLKITRPRFWHWSQISRAIANLLWPS